MNCPKCNRENEEGALFCRYCGSSMNPIQEESNASSILLLVWIIAVAILSIITFAYTRLIDSWYEGGAKIGYIALQIIHNLIMILPAFAIKNKTYRIIGIIVMSCLILWWLFQNISWAMESI